MIWSPFCMRCFAHPNLVARKCAMPSKDRRKIWSKLSLSAHGHNRYLRLCNCARQSARQGGLEEPLTFKLKEYPLFTLHISTALWQGVISWKRDSWSKVDQKYGAWYMGGDLRICRWKKKGFKISMTRCERRRTGAQYIQKSARYIIEEVNTHCAVHWMRPFVGLIVANRTERCRPGEGTKAIDEARFHFYRPLVYDWRKM